MTLHDLMVAQGWYKFTPEQWADYRAYEAVRTRGKYNMFSPQAMRATGLTNEEYRFVMANYAALKVEAEEKLS